MPAQLATTNLGTLATEAPATMEALAVGWLKGYRNPRTRDAYAADLRRWIAECDAAELPVMAATADSLEWWARLMEERDGLAPSTVARRLAAVSSFYKYAEARGAITKNPGTLVRRPQVPDTSQQLGLTADEAKAILQAARDAGPRDYALVMLLTMNGLRVSEVCSADVADLDTVQGHRVLTVTRKRGKRDTVPLAPPTIAAVDAVAGDSGPLLLANDGGRLDRFDAGRIVRRVARAAGITRKVSPHTLRHTCATLMLRAGVPLDLVQDAMAHADPRTTKRYTKAARSLDEHATYQLAGVLA